MLSMFQILIYSMIPVLFYAGIIFLASPQKTISINRTFSYLTAGVISVLACLGFQYLFPQWREMFFDKDSFSQTFWFAFICVALLEEGIKFILFKIFNYFERPNKDNNLVSTVFNYTMVAGGFAIAENILYGMNYGEAALITRAFSAVICHMACGIAVGYFIALGRSSNIASNLEFEKIFLRNSISKRLVFTVMGLLVAILFHGTYDFNLFYPTNSTLLFAYILLAIALWAGRAMYKDIKERHFKELSKE